MAGVTRIFTDMPGWVFKIEEISAGVYRVRGTDEFGRSAEVSGVGEDAVLNDCRRAAAAISARPLHRSDL